MFIQILICFSQISNWYSAIRAMWEPRTAATFMGLGWQSPKVAQYALRRARGCWKEPPASDLWTWSGLGTKGRLSFSTHKIYPKSMILPQKNIWFFFYFILKYNVCRQWGKKCSLYLFCWFHNKSSNKYIWWRGILIPYWSVCVPYLYPDLIEVKFKKVPIFVRGFLSINSMYSKSGKFDQIFSVSTIWYL